MRISIRRCLSMLRNTSNGNELAMPLPMPIKEHSAGVGTLRIAAHALSVPRISRVAALAVLGWLVSAAPLGVTFPVGQAKAWVTLLRS